MIIEDKQLLLKDISARLPYGVICDRLGQAKKLLSISPYKVYCLEFDNGEYMPGKYKVEDIKPYLRPMSSMTEEEKSIMDSLWKENNKLVFADPDSIRRYRFYDISVVDFLNKRHLDYRGLIEKGLALEASEGMYEND